MSRGGEGERGTFLEVLAVFLRLGLTSFGGPVAHLGFFRAECVERRGWLDDRAYADLVALCQFLPGPASSQVGIGLGYRRAGLPGAFAAWLGFTLPSALLLAAFAFGVRAVGGVEGAGWLHGLKIVAVAVVAHAVWGMATRLTPDAPRITVAIAAAMTALLWTGALAQVTIIAGGAALGLGWLPRPGHDPSDRRGAADVPGGVSRRTGAMLLTVFALLLLALPLARELPLVRERTGAQAVGVADAFYRTGALVFGGGHVVLPLIQAEVVPVGWVDDATFIAGYGAAQAVPGPLFTFSAFLGASMAPGAAGAGYAAVALLALFAPSFLLLLGVLPFWESLRRRVAVRRALVGVNAAVVGLLLAALYHPVWTAAVAGPRDVALVLAAYLALAVWRVPPWLVVVAGGALTAVLGDLGL